MPMGASWAQDSKVQISGFLIWVFTVTQWHGPAGHDSAQPHHVFGVEDLGAGLKTTFRLSHRLI